MTQDKIVKLPYSRFLNYLAGSALIMLGSGASMQDIVSFVLNWGFRWREANPKADWK